MKSKDKEIFLRYKVAVNDVFTLWRKHHRDELFLIKLLTVLIYARKEKCLCPVVVRTKPEGNNGTDSSDIKNLDYYANSGMKNVHVSILRHLLSNKRNADDNRLYEICNNAFMQLSEYLNPLFGFLHGAEFVEFVDCLLELYDDTEYSCLLNFLFESYRQQEGCCREESIQYPVEVLKLALSLLNIKEGDKLCHDFAGTDSLLNILPKNVSYVSEEKDSNLSDLAYLRACILGIDNVEFQNRDTLGKLISGDINEDGIHHLITPTFEETGYCDWYDYSRRIEHKHTYTEKPYLQALNRMLYDATTSSCIIVPAYILCSEDADCTYLRRAYGSENLIRTIILLPTHLFVDMPLQTALIFEESDTVVEKPIFQFIDASHCFVIDEDGRKRLNPEEVLDIVKGQNPDYSKFVLWNNNDDNLNIWDPRLFFPFKKPNLLSLVIGVDNDNIEIVEESGINGPLVTLKELADNIYDILSDKDIPFRDVPEGSQKITSSALLISKSRKNLRPTRIEASLDSPVYIDSYILCLPLSRESIDINPLYLAYKLSEADPYELFPGGIDSDLSMTELFLASIDMSDIKKQDEMADSLEREHKKAKVREARLNELMEEMRTEYINEVRMRKHDMKPYIEDLLDSHDLLKYYFEQSKIDNDIAGEIKDLLMGMHKSITSLSESLNNLSVDDKFGEPELIDIDVFLHGMAERYESTTNFKVEYNINDENLKYDECGKVISPIVSINSSDLQCICDNIINNARVHGFVDDKRTDYAIHINLSVNSKSNQCVIDFCNNGLEFPDGLTKERYGLKGEKAGSTGNTGIGGYRVKSITRHFDGDYDIIYKNKTLMPNIIRIYLPIIE